MEIRNHTQIRESSRRKFSFRRLVEELITSNREKDQNLPARAGVNITTPTHSQPLNPLGNRGIGQVVDQSHVVALFCVAVIGCAFVVMAVAVLVALWYVKRYRGAVAASTPADRRADSKYRASTRDKLKNRFASRPRVGGKRKAKTINPPPVYTINSAAGCGGLTNQTFQMSPPIPWSRNYGVRASFNIPPSTANQTTKIADSTRYPPTPDDQLIKMADIQGKQQLGTGSRSLGDSCDSSGIGSCVFDSTTPSKLAPPCFSTSRGGMKKRKSLMEALEDLASGDISAMSGYKLPFPLQQPPTPMADSDGCEDDLESGIVNGYSPSILNRSLDQTSPRPRLNNSFLHSNQRLTPVTSGQSGVGLGPPSPMDRREIIVDPSRFYRRSSSKNSLTLPVIPEIHVNSDQLLPTPRVVVGTVRSLGRRFSRRPINRNVTARDYPIEQLTPFSSIPPPTTRSSPTGEGDVDEEWKRVVKEIQDLGSTNGK